MDDRLTGQESALVRFAAAMDAVGVEYLLTGSTAMNFYAVVRMTNDIDLVVNPKPYQERLVAKVLAEDFEADARTIEEALRERQSFSLIDPESLAALDVSKGFPEITTRDVFNRARMYELDDQPVKVISPEDLVVSKLYWARASHSEMQFRDVKNLLATALDLSYIRRRCAGLGIAGLLAEIQQHE